MKANHLSIEDFGDQLLATQDLDPVYVMLYQGRKNGLLDGDQLHRWLLAYWCFYHAGASTWLSAHDGDEFWEWMLTAARNSETGPVTNESDITRWPRAAERRHFRGDKCVRAVEWMKARYPTQPHKLVMTAYEPSPGVLSPLKSSDVTQRVSAWPQFGPWIAFKAADMIERVLGVPVQFPADDIIMYREPRAALDILVNDRGGTAGNHFARLLNRFHNRPAPPAMDRACGPQEIETICCKWKSYLGGHYYVGKDTLELRHGMQDWGPLSRDLSKFLPTIAVA